MVRSLICTLFLFASFVLFAQKTSSKEVTLLLEEIQLAHSNLDLELYTTLLYKVKYLSKKNKDTLTLLQVHRKLLTYFSFEKQNKDSIQYYYNEGTNILRIYKNAMYHANFEYIRGANLTSNGEYTKAYKIYNSIENDILESNYEFLPHFYGAFARLHYLLEELDLSFEKLKKSAHIFEERKDLRNTSSIYNNLGILYKSQKAYDSSIVYHKKSLDISRQLKDTLSIAYSFNNMGRTYFLNNNPLKAENYYQKAIAINPLKPSLSLLNNYSEVLIMRNEFIKAEEFLLQTREEAIMPQTEINALASLIVLKKLQYKYKEAIVLSDTLIAKKEALLNSNKIIEIEKLKAKHDTEKKAKQILLLKEKTENQELLINQNRLISTALTFLFFLLILVASFIWYTKTMQAKVQEVLLKQQLLRSQMNPHFIFNALTNIQTTILKKENTKAVHYLAKFSKLVRSILENSQHSKITFEKEINALEYYLQLQKIRFEDQLEYNISIDEQIEPELTYIPTMLFQPLIENAIEHGVESVDQGKIDISFILKDHCITCIVEDNGIGYSNTVSLKKDSKESMSSEIIKNRLSILSKKEKQIFNYTIEDILENASIKGTRASIDIPIIP